MDRCLGTYLEGQERWTVGPLHGTDLGPGEVLRITEVLQGVLQVFCTVSWLLGLPSCQLLLSRQSHAWCTSITSPGA